MLRYFTLFAILAFLLLLISGCSSSGARAPVSDLSLNKKTLTHYEVKEGDTLYGIAWKNNLEMTTLAQRNNLQAPYIIYPGDILNLASQMPQITNKTPKTRPLPQNTLKTSCSAQTCTQNSKEKLVQTKTKEYPDHKVTTNESQKNIKITGNQKVSTWHWPTNGQMTKTFSSSQAGMKGISLSNQRGTPIYAMATGLVVYAGSALRGYGNLIIIKHNDDYLSAYAHNEKLLVNESENIVEGQKIATMGDSGTESVHLYFEIRYRGKAVDPERYLPKR